MNTKRYTPNMLSEYDMLRIVIPSYDKLQDQLAGQILKHFKNSNIKIIDVGCGSGLTSLAIMKKLPNADITLIDNDKSMIKRAKERCGQKLQYICCDALEYLKSIPNQTVDCFASGLLLHGFTKNTRSNYISEAFRITTTGGLFVNADKYVRDNTTLQKKDFKSHINCFRKLKDLANQELVNQWTRHCLRDMNENIIMRLDDALNELETVGYKNLVEAYRKNIFAVVMAEK